MKRNPSPRQGSRRQFEPERAVATKDGLTDHTASPVGRSCRGERSRMPFSHKAQSVIGGLALLAGMLTIPLVGTPAYASTTLNVSTTGSNAGNCQNNPCATISYAVSQAASGDTIDVAAGTYQDIVSIPATLTGLTITGPTGGATVDGESTTAQVGSVFAVYGGASVTLENLTISDGEGTVFGDEASGDGVFISENASADLVDDTITNNTDCRVGNVEGAGVYNSGTATLSDDTVSNNTACGLPGGGIFTASGSSTALTNDTISGNVGGGTGGGLFNSGWTTLNDDTVAGNTAAYVELGSANAGGGIYNDEGTVELNADTIAGNTAVYGGGVATSSDATTDLAGSIVGTNSQTPGSGNCDIVSDSTWSDDGYNLAADGSCGLSSSTSLPGTNPELGTLTNNGGMTQTMEPQVGSPAINKIPDPTSADTFSLCPGTDQRGVSRPQGPACDIGSVEVRQTTPEPAISGVSFSGSASHPTVTITGTGFGNAPAGTAEPANCGWLPLLPGSGSDYASNDLSLIDVTGGWHAGLTIPSPDCVGLDVTYSPTQVVLKFGSYYKTHGWTLNAGDAFTVNVASATASATVEYSKIRSVSFSGSSSDPTVTIEGRGFGSGPAASASGAPGGGSGTDYNLDELYVLDTSSGWYAGQPGNWVTVNVVSYTNTRVVLQFGSYYDYYNTWVLDPGASYAVGVAGASTSGVVSYH